MIQNVSEHNSLRANFSNSYESLAETLVESLFQPSSQPFEKRYVLVPSESIKEFLHGYLARHPRLTICTGVHILLLEQGVVELLQLCRPHQGKKIPSFLELSLALEHQMHRMPRHDPLFSPLWTYVDQDPTTRMAALSDQLAKIFLRYGVYGTCADWLEHKGWQQALWRSLFSSALPLTTPFDTLSESGTCDAKVHLFGFSYLSPLHLSFFYRLQATLYQLSPCAQYWEDVCSDREKLHLQRTMLRVGVSRIVRDDMERYLQDRHPLLANWGKLGREMLKELDPYLTESKESYAPRNRESTLSAVQDELLLLKPCDHTSACDTSLQIHNAPSKWREVEVMKDHIIACLKRGAQPKEIVVLAPDIARYAPYLHMVLGSIKQLAYRIEDLEQGSISTVAQSLMQLIELLTGEVSLSSVETFLRLEPVRARWGWTLEDVHLICSWLQSAHIRSGEESWEAGLDRLIFGLGMESGQIDGVSVWPIDCIEQSDVEMFGVFLQWYDQLKKDRKQIVTYPTRTLSEWLHFFIECAERQCDCHVEDESLLRQMRALQLETLYLKGSDWKFSSVQRIAKYFYQQRRASIAAEHRQMITCSSLKSGVARPAKVVYVMGLDEESFPRKEMKSSLSSKAPSYIPSQMDEDRYLLLELLCSVKETLFLSYTRIHPQDNKQQGPSYLIDELCAIRNISIIEHPADVVRTQAYASKRQFFSTALSLSDDPLISIAMLRKLARHPIQFYFNQVLGIYLKEEEDRVNEAFCLSGLKQHALKRAALKSSMDSILKQSTQQGVMPDGLFKHVAACSLKEGAEDLLSSLSAFNLHAKEIFSVELSLHCEEPIQLNDGNWVVPALKIDDHYIIGTLNDITSRGYLIHAEKKAAKLLPHWPLYLIYLHIKHHVGALPDSLLCAKDGTSFSLLSEEAEKALKEYLRYYQLARQSVSPLMPEWAPSFFKGQEEWKRTIEKGKGPFAFSDPYVEWLDRQGIALDTESLFSKWEARLKQCLHPLLERLT